MATNSRATTGSLLAQARGLRDRGRDRGRSGESVQDQEDRCATARAVFAVLLAAHRRGLAGYRRTPEVLRTSGGFKALGIPPDERFVALIDLGWPRQESSRLTACAERLPPVRRCDLPRLSRGEVWRALGVYRDKCQR